MVQYWRITMAIKMASKYGEFLLIFFSCNPGCQLQGQYDAYTCPMAVSSGIYLSDFVIIYLRTEVTYDSQTGDYWQFAI
jgi:hypothetical protein